MLEFSRVTLAGPLWTVDEVKAHLRITDAAHDADVAQIAALSRSSSSPRCS